MGILVCGVSLLILGVLMFALPKLFIKKDVTVGEEHLRQVRNSGIAEMVFGAVLIVVGAFVG